jgi:hypothetical protein
MIPTHDLTRTLVNDRRIRFEQAAARRSLLATLRHRLARPTPVVEVAVAAPAPIVLGRTPSTIEHRAA